MQQCSKVETLGGDFVTSAGAVCEQKILVFVLQMEKLAGSWGQVCWVLGWKCTPDSLLLFYFSSLLCFFSLFFKTFLLFYSLKSQSSDLHCPMFSLICSITPEVPGLRLTDTQQQQQQTTSHAASQPTASQSVQSPNTLTIISTSCLTSPPHIPLPSSSSISFIYSGKQGKSAVLPFALTLFCSWGCAKLSLKFVQHSCAYVKFSQASHTLLPTHSCLLIKDLALNTVA
jgi:hypothetical protein